KYNLILYDRQNVHPIFNNVEFADLYNADNKELIHVKIGGAPEWRYCIKQSSQVARLINIHSAELAKDKVPRVEELTLLLITNNRNIFEGNSINFKESKSLYFKTEI